MSERPNFYYEIHFPDFQRSEYIESDIEKYLGRLNRIFNKIISCQVVVRAPHRHGRRRFYHIDIQLNIPGRKLLVSRETEQNDDHTNIHLAIRDAFNRLKRQLRETVKHMRTYPDKVVSLKRGTVKSYDPNLGYGFVVDSQGREIYFHKHSVDTESVESLAPGKVVHFDEEQSEKGPHVSSLSVVFDHTA